MNIYNTIRFLRHSKGYSQEYVAEKLGVDTVTYGRVESGKIKLTIERLYDISTVLGYDIKKIIELSEKINETENDNKTLINLIQQNILLSEQILEKLKK